MQVIRGYSTNPTQPITNPFPVAGTNFFFELRGGDILHPFGDGDWFNPPYFPRNKVWRTRTRHNCLPFISWRWPSWFPWIGGKSGYMGFKAFGADHDEYKNWMSAEDVYAGSEAMQMSIRIAASRTT